MPCKVRTIREDFCLLGFIFSADYAINNNLTPFISMQNQYSLVYREEEREMFPTLKVRFHVSQSSLVPQ